MDCEFGSNKELGDKYWKKHCGYNFFFQILPSVKFLVAMALCISVYQIFWYQSANIFELLSLEVAEDVPFAKVLRNNSILEKEEVVPFRSAVILGLGSPKEPKND